ncbi:ClpX C4-type zinc finger protein [Actinokineospora sp. UTMC 2448]|uniref:ClpX C4-type zinc finger protein n=1 Tax=Actinokineospora sp. UTMC 2448 TaxID=2268449 RepID=UPI002164792F|nr:ClpX C4-type zinc finger protein [Actinokineospora sp. UTMC 2448]UVS78895.1 ATP-dependent protease ATP-binding subunit ClpX [Actinokineospora sp. UTMC 2448]
MLNDDLLRLARQAAINLAEAQERAEGARTEYHQAVRRLHLAGASLREIADALEISHQRVHQMVEEAGGTPGWKPRRTPPEPACSFCGVTHTEPGSLVAGPGVYICHACVAASTVAIADAKDQPQVATPLACSFCDRPATEAQHLATGPGVRICERCVGFCSEIVDLYLD